MKHITYLCLNAAILVGLMAPLAAAQNQNDNLGEYARQNKKKKQTSTMPKKVYDSDNLPSAGTVSVVGAVPQDRDRANNGHQPETDAQGNAKTDTTPGQSVEDREKVYENWKKQIADQKQTVDRLQGELNQLLRQYQGIPIAQYKQETDAKQQALDSAKQQLADLQERARKAGVASKLRE
jgi:DNA repair exonuclease SbcCD ATPase subunit